jgi:hypothetical protein
MVKKLVERYKRWRQYKKYKKLYDLCHFNAIMLVKDFGNSYEKLDDKDAQKYINDAKDSLYDAARIFDKQAEEYK